MQNCLYLGQLNSTFLTTPTISVDFTHSSVTFRPSFDVDVDFIWNKINKVKSKIPPFRWVEITIGRKGFKQEVYVVCVKLVNC